MVAEKVILNRKFALGEWFWLEKNYEYSKDYSITYFKESTILTFYNTSAYTYYILRWGP